MRKIMIVDDEPDMVDILKLMLESSGYKTCSALSGKECLDRVNEENPDLILLDIRMPEMDGWETLKGLKKKGVTDRTDIIVLTVEKGPGVEIFGLQDVVFDYIIKPFEKEKLLEVIRRVEKK